MKKLKVGLIVFGILCTLSGYAQEEFFGKNRGLNLSYGTLNFNDNYNLGISYYSKKSWIISGVYSHIDNYSQPIIFSVGYLKNLTKKDNLVETKVVMGLTCLVLSNSRVFIPAYFGPNLALSFIISPKSNFPFFLGASAYAYFKITERDQSTLTGLTLNYTQAFFAKNTVYPFIGISKSFNFLYQSSDNLYFRAGLNIKLSEPDKPKK